MSDAALQFEPEQSPHWDERKDFVGFLEKGFPFDEGWPVRSAEFGAKYMIILRDGSRTQASVDLHRQYMAEGRGWIADGAIRHPDYAIVIAWKRVA